MPTISNVSFNVKFDLTGTPLLVLTDTTSTPPTGLVGIFEITQPDKYTRTGNINSPDISLAGGSFSYQLRLDSLGKTQCGTYVVKFTANAPGYLSTDFTRTFIFQYVESELVITEDFDVFTPQLRYIDDTNYAQSGYNSSAITRSWAANSIPTGNIPGSGVILDLKYNNNYYSALYNATLTSNLIYTSQTYSWLTISESLSKSISSCAGVPPTISEIVNDISEIKLEYDNSVNACKERADLKAKFEWAQSLLDHIIDRLSTGNTDNISNDLSDLIEVLNNNQNVCNPTNGIIPPYNISQLIGPAIWGNIVGNIESQTDLVAYILAQISDINLNELNDVDINTYINKGLIYRDTATNTWKHDTVAGILGYVPANSAISLTINGVTYDLTADRTWSISEVPEQSGQNGKYLKTNGTVAFWDDIPLSDYVPLTRTLTINGVAYDLSADRVWDISSLPEQSGQSGKYLRTDGTIAFWDVINLDNYVPNSRTLTINGVAYDLSENRSWTIDAPDLTPYQLKSEKGQANGYAPLNASSKIDASYLPVLNLNDLGDVVISSPTSNQGIVYDSVAGVWKNQTIVSSAGVRNVETFTSTAGQTTFTTTGYVVGSIDVYLNGSRLQATEYTATDAATVVFPSGLVVGDIVEVVIWSISSVSGGLVLDTTGFGEDVSYNSTTNKLTIDKYSWMDLARGYTVEPTLFATTATYEVYQYVYSSSTFYRKIMNDNSEDAFYSESALTNKLCEKKIIV